MYQSERSGVGRQDKVRAGWLSSRCVYVAHWPDTAEDRASRARRPIGPDTAPLRRMPVTAAFTLAGHQPDMAEPHARAACRPLFPILLARARHRASGEPQRFAHRRSLALPPRIGLNVTPWHSPAARGACRTTPLVRPATTFSSRQVQCPVGRISVTPRARRPGTEASSRVRARGGHRGRFGLLGCSSASGAGRAAVVDAARSVSLLAWRGRVTASCGWWQTEACRGSQRRSENSGGGLV